MDWPRVKEGLRGEIQTTFAAMMQEEKVGEDNAFAQGLAAVIAPAMVNQLIEAQVTPSGLIHATEQPSSDFNPKNATLNYAFSPMAFRADVGSGATSGVSIPLSIFLEFTGTGWKVTHAAYPSEQLVAAIRNHKATAKGNETPIPKTDPAPAQVNADPLPPVETCKIEDWRYFESAAHIKIEGTTTCESGRLDIRAYDSSDKFLGNSFTYIKGYSFRPYIEAQMPKALKIKYTISTR